MSGENLICFGVPGLAVTIVADNGVVHMVTAAEWFERLDQIQEQADETA